MRTPHTNTHTGKRIRLILRDGDTLSGRFAGRTHRWVELDHAGTVRRVAKADIRAFIIVKGVA